jgi:hypothetical protein
VPVTEPRGKDRVIRRHAGNAAPLASMSFGFKREYRAPACAAARRPAAVHGGALSRDPFNISRRDSDDHVAKRLGKHIVA